ncbi:hypothetical protein [uncultured Roseobacter sp.]|uniref:hypothetical protein n=1 Tax=uncultured Roseobacter sp. TaxID=114847 RepID=UPI00260A0E54|nr:hypothetical protein [uncultured Roseobacter sp.]
MGSSITLLPCRLSRTAYALTLQLQEGPLLKLTRKRDGCHRNAARKEDLVENAGLDAREIACLGILRLFISTFAEPKSQNWMRALGQADDAFGIVEGPVIARRLILLLQAVRCSRRSVFMFSNPDCDGCARVLTEHERRLISAIQSFRLGRPEQAQLQLMMLCEGNSTRLALDRLADLMKVLDPRTTPRAFEILDRGTF